MNHTAIMHHCSEPGTWDINYDNTFVIFRTSDPLGDTAQLLHERGLTGTLTIKDGASVHYPTTPEKLEELPTVLVGDIRTIVEETDSKLENLNDIATDLGYTVTAVGPGEYTLTGGGKIVCEGNLDKLISWIWPILEMYSAVDEAAEAASEGRRLQ